MLARHVGSEKTPLDLVSQLTVAPAGTAVHPATQILVAPVFLLHIVPTHVRGPIIPSALHFIEILWWRCLKKTIHGIKNQWNEAVEVIRLSNWNSIDTCRGESLYTWPNFKACHFYSR